MIPLLHDFTDETVLVVGGGPVGARKARRFDAEARVVVLSPVFEPGADFGDAALVRAALEPADVDAWLSRIDPALVVAATDDGDLNEALATAAREQGRLVNRADVAGERSRGSVVLPAILRDDPVVVGVGTGGTSPALSAHLKREIESTIDGAGAMAELTGSLRDDLAARDVPKAQRRRALRAVLNSREVWTALDTGGSKPRQLAEDLIEDVTGDST